MPQHETRVEFALPSPTKLFTPAVTSILILIIISYALVSYLPDLIINNFALNPRGLFGGKLWQVLSYSLINPSSCSLGFNIITILFLGSAIERQWRARSFFSLWAVVSIVCALLWCIIGFIFRKELIGIGSTPCVYGIIGAFGLLFRRQRFLFFFWTVEAQHLALLFIGIGIVVGIAMPITWIWIAGAGVAYLYIKLLWRKTSGGSRGVPKRKNFVEI